MDITDEDRQRIPLITITHTEELPDPLKANSTYTSYSIRIETLLGTSLTAERRFREFIEFEKVVHALYPTIREQYPLPPAKALFNKSAKLIEERRKALEIYLRGVCPVKAIRPLLSQFLGYNEEEMYGKYEVAKEYSSITTFSPELTERMSKGIAEADSYIHGLSQQQAQASTNAMQEVVGEDGEVYFIPANSPVAPTQKGGVVINPDNASNRALVRGNTAAANEQARRDKEEFMRKNAGMIASLMPGRQFNLAYNTSGTNVDRRTSLGRLQISVWYRPGTGAQVRPPVPEWIEAGMRYEDTGGGALMVDVHTGMDLPSTDGISNPYVKMYITPDPEKKTKKKTTSKQYTVNPTWNESFIFSDIYPNELSIHQLTVSVWDERIGGKNSCIGEFVLSDLHTLPRNVKERFTNWYDLKPWSNFASEQHHKLMNNAPALPKGPPPKVRNNALPTTKGLTGVLDNLKANFTGGEDIVYSNEAEKSGPKPSPAVTTLSSNSEVQSKTSAPLAPGVYSVANASTTSSTSIGSQPITNFTAGGSSNYVPGRTILPALGTQSKQIYPTIDETSPMTVTGPPGMPLPVTPSSSNQTTPSATPRHDTTNINTFEKQPVSSGQISPPQSIAASSPPPPSACINVDNASSSSNPPVGSVAALALRLNQNKAEPSKPVSSVPIQQTLVIPPPAPAKQASVTSPSPPTPPKQASSVPASISISPSSPQVVSPPPAPKSISQPPPAPSPTRNTAEVSSVNASSPIVKANAAILAAALQNRTVPESDQKQLNSSPPPTQTYGLGSFETYSPSSTSQPPPSPSTNSVILPPPAPKSATVLPPHKPTSAVTFTSVVTSPPPVPKPAPILSSSVVSPPPAPKPVQITPTNAVSPPPAPIPSSNVTPPPAPKPTPIPASTVVSPPPAPKSVATMVSPPPAPKSPTTSSVLPPPAPKSPTITSVVLPPPAPKSPTASSAVLSPPTPKLTSSSTTNSYNSEPTSVIKPIPMPKAAPESSTPNQAPFIPAGEPSFQATTPKSTSSYAIASSNGPTFDDTPQPIQPKAAFVAPQTRNAGFGAAAAVAALQAAKRNQALGIKETSTTSNQYNSQPTTFTGPPAFTPTAQFGNAIVIADYTPTVTEQQDNNVIVIHANDRVEVIDTSAGEWYFGKNVLQKEGYFPASFIKML